MSFYITHIVRCHVCNEYAEIELDKPICQNCCENHEYEYSEPEKAHLCKYCGFDLADEPINTQEQP